MDGGVAADAGPGVGLPLFKRRLGNDPRVVQRLEQVRRQTYEVTDEKWACYSTVKSINYDLLSCFSFEAFLFFRMEHGYDEDTFQGSYG